MSLISDNLAQVQERIAQAASRTGRRMDEITLVAVTKKQPESAVREALSAGVLDLGENYVQEAAAKRDDITGGRWHLLGHLQSNKARHAAALFDLIQSVDSIKLASAISREAKAVDAVPDILLQVHLGDEATKTGLPPDQVLDAAAEIAAFSNVTLRGLMGIAPYGVDPRPYFQQARRLWEALPQENRQILSIGMSGDFETALEEGATMVRVGTAIFGARQ